ncbi:MAG TPA: hypothetical protein VH416_02075 [Gaiellaceae bacterium]
MTTTTTTTPVRAERVDIAAERPFAADSLVGSFFHSEPEHWQGVVVAEPFPGVYLVETFEWFAGSRYEQRLVWLDEMKGWHFYDDSEWMVNAYEHGLRHRWEREREESRASGAGEERDEVPPA